MVFLGIDAKKFIRKGRTKDFIALMGISVFVDDYEKFKEDYVSVMKSLLEKRGISVTKKIYKSHELNKMNIDVEFYKEFYNSIKDKINKLYICYSYFSERDGKRFFIFPFDNKDDISVVEFIVRYLDSSYPYICLWELLKDGDGLEGTAFLDGITGKITNAWKSIENSKDFFILPNGDKTNALISSSDILMTFLDNSLLENRKKLNEAEIKNVFSAISEKIETSFISNACTYHIIPLSERQNIPVLKKIKHPTVYIIKEKGKYVDNEAIEESPVIKKIADFCFKNNGCYKFFESKADYSAISSEDYLFPLGDEAEKSMKALKILGYSFKEIDLSKLDNID